MTEERRRMRLDGTVAIVTGGASGIGRCTVERLVGEGARVAIADVDVKRAQALSQKLRAETGDASTLAVGADVTSEADAAAMVRASLERFGRVDVLVNNVGTYPHVPFEQITYQEWRKVMTVNLDSVFLSCRAVLPAMKGQESGRIINVATNLVWIGLAGMVHYVTAKAGIIGLTRSLAREVGEYGIAVNAVAPGPLVPPVDQLDDEALGRLVAIVNYQCLKRYLEPDDVAAAIAFLASVDADFISGQVLTVDGGLTTH
jgi:NAD(P)-dependent dehydrogenase (short-subunit alcohol dehydrogenase family)